MTPIMQRDRLLLLRAHMAKIAAGELATGRLFHMGIWWSSRIGDANNKNAKHWQEFLGLDEQPSCGTACCLLGEATQIEEFAHAGLTVRGSTVWYDDGTFGASSQGTDAAADFFGLMNAEAYFIFMGYGYMNDLIKDGRVKDRDEHMLDCMRVESLITPADCIAHIDRVLAEEFRAP